ncbi:MAG TPA: ribonuclease P protein component [Segeticoccus sp.]|nr:ribonuclease P protein component [Segeticoccus sp.]
MLAAAHRLRRSPDFSSTVRGTGSARSGSRRLVVHVNHRSTATAAVASSPADAGPVPRVGFVVSRAVGNAVVRNRTKRVLRHLMATRLEPLPCDADVVVRANPAAAGATTDELAGDLDRCLRGALDKLDRHGPDRQGRDRKGEGR